MANNISSNDKYFFRNEGLPDSANVPRDITWAITEDTGFTTGTVSEGDSSYVGQITFDEKFTDEEWQPSTGPIDSDQGLTQCPTPIIKNVVSQRVAQNAEGVARTSVTLAVQCIDNVEYEVMVTPA